MPAPTSSTERVQFGVFELDLTHAELRKSGVKVKLQEQPLKILQILLENPGQIVSREELQKRLWPSNTFVEFDQGLYSAMARLRDALGDSSDSPRFVETVARRGYRFIAAVTHVPTSPIPVVASELRPNGAARKTFTFRRLAANVVAGLVGGALLLAAMLEFDIAGAREWLRTRTTPIRSIAVLPLQNLSGDPEQEYFADGMTDELISDLAQRTNLRVISRTSVMHYKKTSKTLPEIARELQVDGVVEGSVERSGNRVRIRVQLVRAMDDRHLWAQAYEREFRDVLRLQADAAREIAEQVGLSVAMSSGARQANRGHLMKPEAYENYLKGRYYSRTGKGQDAEIARAYLLKAIQQDPDAAPPYAGLANAYVFEAYFGPQRKEAAKQAHIAATKALRIDPELADAHLAMTSTAELDWQWAEAEKHYRRAVELEPGSPDGHLHFGMFLAALGRFSEAIPETRMALRLDPMSADTHASSGFTFYLTGDFDHAIQHGLTALEIDPNYDDAHAFLFHSYWQKGEYELAVQEFTKFAGMKGFSPESINAINQAYSKGGIKGFWREHLILNAARRIPALDSFDLASVYVALGENSKALDYLHEAYGERDPKMGFLRVLPELRGLQSELQFRELIRQVGLPGS
jgi:TolB-like protein/DNA-binding winged helix-turn-helix (wHTH) protein/Tfp pilus assembly protein PilF